MKFTKTLAAITAAAMAVSMAAIPASAVESELGTSGTCIAKKGEWGPDATCIQINGKAVDENSAFDFAATDVVTVTAAAANGEDTSLWNLAFNCFDASWGGWQGVQSEAGVLELTATVQDMMDAISVTDAANFGGFIFQVWNCQVGDEIDWTIKIAPGEVTPEEPEEPEEPDAPETEVPGESEEVPGESEDVPTDPEVPGETTDPEEPGEEPEEPGEEPEEPAEPAAPTKVEITNGGKTVIDAGLVRTNIINAWANDDACVIAEKTAFAGAELVSVKFTVTGVTEAFDAWLSFADSSWACQFWGADNAGNVGGKSTIVRIEKDGTYVVTATLDQVIEAMEFIAVCTNLEAAEGDAIPTITIDEIMINEEIKLPADQPEEPKDPEDPKDPEEPGETTEPEEPGETTEPEEPGESTTPGESSGTPMNPGTGVALVVVPAALAAAALATSGIVLKKRSK